MGKLYFVNYGKIVNQYEKVEACLEDPDKPQLVIFDADISDVMKTFSGNNFQDMDYVSDDDKHIPLKGYNKVLSILLLYPSATDLWTDPRINVKITREQEDTEG